jgi:hypothetical protein
VVLSKRCKSIDHDETHTHTKSSRIPRARAAAQLPGGGPDSWEPPCVKSTSHAGKSRGAAIIIVSAAGRGRHVSRRLHVPIAEIIIKRVIILSHAKRSSVRAPRWKIFGPAIEQHTHIQIQKWCSSRCADDYITGRRGGWLILRRAHAHTQLNQRQADIVWLVRFLDRRVCAAEEMNRHTAHMRENRRKEFFRTMQSLYFCYCAGRVESHCASGGEIKKTCMGG